MAMKTPGMGGNTGKKSAQMPTNAPKPTTGKASTANVIKKDKANASPGMMRHDENAALAAKREKGVSPDYSPGKNYTDGPGVACGPLSYKMTTPKGLGIGKSGSPKPASKNTDNAYNSINGTRGKNPTGLKTFGGARMTK